jgi:hypothetical protein
MLMQMRSGSARRSREYMRARAAKLAAMSEDQRKAWLAEEAVRQKRALLVGLAGFAFFIGMVLLMAWSSGKAAEEQFAKHGRCLEWHTYQHVPVHHERCVRWERQ